MKQFIFSSTILSFLIFFINNEEVFATREKRATNRNAAPSPQDGRLVPHKFCGEPQCTPTLRSPPGPSVNIIADAQALKKAMVGIGTDEKSIINILTHRGSIQRLEIVQVYKVNKMGDLVKDLQGELKGKFSETITALLTPLPVFLAKELYEAIIPLGTDELTLVEVLCTISNFGIKSIGDFYHKAYGKTLETAVREDTTGSFQKILVSLIQGKRSEQHQVNPAAVQADAQVLSRPGPKNWGVDNSQFNQIMGTRSYAHLRQVFDAFSKMAGHDIEEDIKRQFTRSTQAGLLLMVRCIRSRSAFLATRLEDSMKGKTVQDRLFIRIMVSRSEIDLGDIKMAYARVYQKELGSTISSKLGGYYRRTMTNLVTG